MVRLLKQCCHEATSFTQKLQRCSSMRISVLLWRKTDPACAAGMDWAIAQAGTAATSPVTPEQPDVLKSQVIKPGTRMGRRRWSKSDASSFTATTGAIPTTALDWVKGAATSEITYPFLLQSRAPRSELRCCALRSDFKYTETGCCRVSSSWFQEGSAAPWAHATRKETVLGHPVLGQAACIDLWAKQLQTCKPNLSLWQSRR